MINVTKHLKLRQHLNNTKRYARNESNEYYNEIHTYTHLYTLLYYLFSILTKEQGFGI